MILGVPALLDQFYSVFKGKKKTVKTYPLKRYLSPSFFVPKYHDSATKYYQLKIYPLHLII
jgi:hypothetical protein